jgi:hypothetical protein
VLAAKVTAKHIALQKGWDDTGTKYTGVVV